MRIASIEKAVTEVLWYDLAGDVVDPNKVDPDTPIFKIKKPTPKEIRALQRRSSKKTYTGRKGKKKDDVEVMQNLLLHECVQDWRNLTQDDRDPDTGKVMPSDDGTPKQVDFPCTKENREHLDGLWSEFSEMWVRVATENAEVEAMMEADETGN